MLDQSQTFAVLSQLPEASRFELSRENATEDTPSLCPLRTAKHGLEKSFPDCCQRQMRTVLSSEAEARKVGETGLNWMALTGPTWPCFVC